VTLKQAQAQMKAVAAQIEHDYPDSNTGWSARVDRYADVFVNVPLRQSLYVLWAAVGAVLLIGCANLANLLLARGAGRAREVAIRSALGASRWCLIRQFLTESIVLAGIGGAAGILIAVGLIAVLKLWMPPFFLPPEASVGLDTRVLMFTVGIAILTGILFGIVPAVQASAADLGGSLKEGGRGATSGVGRRSARSALVVAEVALSFILLSGAGLLIRSFYRLQQVDPGFEATNVITMRLPMAPDQYQDGERVVSYLGQVMERIGAIPGIRTVATTSSLPLQGWGYGMPFLIEGQSEIDRANRPACFFKIVSSTYASALRMRILKGRFLTETDSQGTVPVTVIDESMEKQYFKQQDPIGKRILIQQLVPGKHEVGPEVPWQVVGVIADEKVNSLEKSSPGVYVSYKQSPVPFSALVIQGAMDPNSLVKAVQGAVWGLNKNQALNDIKTLERIKSESLGPNRLRTILLGAFAGLALLLAAGGIYGVISYLVAQRTHELGVRAALGASNLDQLVLVLRSGLFLTCIGLGIGILGALSLDRVLASLLFGVNPRDPWILVAVSVLLAGVVVAACYIPARRAMKVDPMVALRYE
jgi:putative ABC transport system permease protein